MSDMDISPPDSQESCLLFGLPLEIRDRIYEYVIGSGVLHFFRRNCKPSDKHFPLNDDPSTPVDADRSGEYIKLTYTVCPEPSDWNNLMVMSKTSSVPAGQPESLDYSNRHRGCALFCHDFTVGLYAMTCFDSDGKVDTVHKAESERCKKCKRLNDLYISRYGSPTYGLKYVHANTGLDLRFLQTCRRLHDEASLLPLKRYTFDVDWFLTIRDIKVHNVLKAHQLGAIESIHLKTGHASELVAAVRSFPKLKHLHLSMPWVSCLLGKNNEWEMFFASNNLESVQVLCSVVKHSRDATRAHCTAVETFLLSPDWPAAEAFAMQSVHEGTMVIQDSRVRARVWAPWGHVPHRDRLYASSGDPIDWC